MYIGDPNIVFVIYAFSKLLQNPKSQSLIIPLWKNILLLIMICLKHKIIFILFINIVMEVHYKDC
jgi:hypothetical protein